MPIDSVPCVFESSAPRPLHAVRPEGLGGVCSALTQEQSRFVEATGFKGEAQEILLFPGQDGGISALLGLGEDRGPYAFGDIAHRLPVADWQLADGDFDADMAVLGFSLGAYRFDVFKAAEKSAAREPARLVAPKRAERPVSQARSVWLARDLINTPANELGPRELAVRSVELGKAYGARTTIVEGDLLDREYPTIAAVGRGSDRAPAVAIIRWQGSRASETSPLVSLCGKGVCFDTGGYDLKPSAGMLRMKKDMGGAAVILGIAREIMDTDLAVRLEVRIGCVENSVSGHAMRPLDVLRTRRGISVEVGNTDAEGRLVLCDLLAEASDERPHFLLDCATLTGAARVALGPDLPALFANDDGWATALAEAGVSTYDPMWRLPLWNGYDSWLKSEIADINNVSAKPFAGAIVAALFLQRFVASGVPWAHLDLYAWNDSKRPGRPEGGEGHCIRACYSAIQNKIHDPK